VRWDVVIWFEGKGRFGGGVGANGPERTVGASGAPWCKAFEGAIRIGVRRWPYCSCRVTEKIFVNVEICKTQSSLVYQNLKR
jgi:hypothetical protein